jgi:Interferon-induced transmembrane protein
MTEAPTTPTEDASPRLADVPPPSNAGWAVAAVLFFWPLAFSAFNHAFNVYPLWAQGDVVGAKYASDRVRRLGVLSLWLCGALLLVFAILYAIFIIVMISQGHWHHFHGGGMGRHGR